MASQKLLSEIESSISDEDWKKIFAVKDAVNQSIEKARTDSVIKGSLDSKISISCDKKTFKTLQKICLLYTSPSPRDLSTSRMPSSA